MSAGGKKDLTKELFDAIRNKDSESIKSLIEAGADINSTEDGMTALHVAARYYPGETYVLVEEHEEGEVVFSHITQYNAEVMQALIDAGADVNAENNRGETALDIADQYHPEVVGLLEFRSVAPGSEGHDDKHMVILGSEEDEYQEFKEDEYLSSLVDHPRVSGEDGDGGEGAGAAGYDPDVMGGHHHFDDSSFS
ncbi:MAG: ankyrin repeat domain-containing protein [Rickettsiales bacterium]